MLMRKDFFDLQCNRSCRPSFSAESFVTLLRIVFEVIKLKAMSALERRDVKYGMIAASSRAHDLI